MELSENARARELERRGKPEEAAAVRERASNGRVAKDEIRRAVVRSKGDPDPLGLRDKPTRSEKPQVPPKLSDTIRDVLVPAADKLEAALDEREHARRHAHAAVAEFKQALTLVGRAAQTALNRNTVKEQDADNYERTKPLSTPLLS